MPPKPTLQKPKTTLSSVKPMTSTRTFSDDFDGIGNVQLTLNDKKELQAALEVFGETMIKVNLTWECQIGRQYTSKMKGA